MHHKDFLVTLQNMSLRSSFGLIHDATASQKNIKSFTMVFYVFDEDGASPLYARNNVVLTIDEQIPAETKYDFSLNIDKFFYENSDGEYETEYLYVSKIAYEDDTEWTDPLGLEIF